MFQILLITLALTSLFPLVLSQEVCSWVATDGNWSDPTNWAYGIVPDIDCEVSFRNQLGSMYTVTIDVPVVLNSPINIGQMGMIYVNLFLIPSIDVVFNTSAWFGGTIEISGQSSLTINSLQIDGTLDSFITGEGTFSLLKQVTFTGVGNTFGIGSKQFINTGTITIPSSNTLSLQSTGSCAQGTSAQISLLSEATMIVQGPYNFQSCFLVTGGTLIYDTLEQVGLLFGGYPLSLIIRGNSQLVSTGILKIISLSLQGNASLLLNHELDIQGGDLEVVEEGYLTLNASVKLSGNEGGDPGQIYVGDPYTTNASLRIIAPLTYSLISLLQGSNLIIDEVVTVESLYFANQKGIVTGGGTLVISELLFGFAATDGDIFVNTFKLLSNATVFVYNSYVLIASPNVHIYGAINILYSGKMTISSDNSVCSPGSAYSDFTFILDSGSVSSGGWLIFQKPFNLGDCIISGIFGILTFNSTDAQNFTLNGGEYDLGQITIIGNSVVTVNSPITTKGNISLFDNGSLRVLSSLAIGVLQIGTPGVVSSSTLWLQAANVSTNFVLIYNNNNAISGVSGSLFLIGGDMQFSGLDNHALKLPDFLYFGNYGRIFLASESQLSLANGFCSTSSGGSFTFGNNTQLWITGNFNFSDCLPNNGLVQLGFASPSTSLYTLPGGYYNMSSITLKANSLLTFQSDVELEGDLYLFENGHFQNFYNSNFSRITIHDNATLEMNQGVLRTTAIQFSSTSGFWVTPSILGPSVVVEGSAQFNGSIQIFSAQVVLDDSHEFVLMNYANFSGKFARVSTNPQAGLKLRYDPNQLVLENSAHAVSVTCLGTLSLLVLLLLS